MRTGLFPCFRAGLMVLFAFASTAFGQTIVTWTTNVSGLWFDATKWSPAVVPDSPTPSTYRAVISVVETPYTVTANGSTSIDIVGLNVTSHHATVVFDFDNTSTGLHLGSSTSNWTAGNLTFGTTSGISGISTANTTLSISNGVGVSFGTMTGSRSISGLTLSNNGTVSATTGTLLVTGAAVSNQAGGVIHANNAQIIFQGGTTLTNNGTLTATGAAGILRFNDSYTTGQLGNVILSSGGQAWFTGSLNNTAAVLNTPGVGQTYHLVGGTITGGTLASGALTLSGSGGTLSGVTINGTISLPASSTATLTGANSMSNSSVANFGNNSSLRLNSATASLAISANSTLTGDVSIDVVSSSYTGTTLTNAGNIIHNATVTGEMQAANFTNTGNITASAGTLNLGATFAGFNTTNSANITANTTGRVNIIGNFTNSGSVTARDSGIIAFQGTTTSAGLGNVILLDAGQVWLTGTLNNTNLVAPIGGSYLLVGGTVSGGTINNLALMPTSSGGTLSGVTMTGSFTLPASSTASLTGTNTFTNATASFGTNSSLRFGSATGSLAINGNSTLSGDVSIDVISSSYTGTTLTNAGSVLHNSSSTGEMVAANFTNTGSITGSLGTINLGTTFAGFNSTNTGNGTITANGTGRVNVIGNFTNTGNATITATDSGIIAFQGTNSSGNLGNVIISGAGQVWLNGTIVNANLTQPTGGSYLLVGGTISGGNITNNSVLPTGSGGTLHDVNVTGNFTLPASSTASLTGNNTFTNATASFGSNSSLRFGSATASLAINANSTLSGDVSIDVISSSYTGTTLTNAGSVLHNSSSTGEMMAANFTNTGSITGSLGTINLGTTFAGFNSTNTGNGTITANGTGRVNVIGNFTNTGNATITATDSGIIAFQGTNSSGNLGNVIISGAGQVWLNGTIVNANLTQPTGGSYLLVGGTISGGTIANNSVLTTGSGGTLHDVNVTGNFTLPASSTASLTGNNTFTNATVSFGSNSSLRFGSATASLAINANSTLSGDVSIDVISSSYTGTTLTNAGNILHNSSTASGELMAGNFTNTGSITGSLGTLFLGTTFGGFSSTNTGNGTITANGTGRINVVGNFANTGNGTITATDSGLVVFQGTNTSANLGNIIISGAGQVWLNGTIVNTNLTQPTGGSYLLVGGTISGGNITNNSVLPTGSGGTLSGVNLTGNFTLPASSTASLTGANTFTNATASFGSNSSLRFGSATASLAINANSTLSGDVSIDVISSSYTGTTLTNAGNIVHNNGAATGELMAGNFTNTGSITGSLGTLNLGTTFGGFNSTNTGNGTITANGTGRINIVGNYANTGNGTITATDSGLIVFQGTNSSGNLGNIIISGGGQVWLNGTIANANLTQPTGGSFLLVGGTISGGTVGSNAVQTTSSGGTFSGVDLTGTLILPASSTASLTANNSLTNAAAAFATNSSLRFGSTTGSLVISGNSTLTGDVSIDVISSSYTGTTLTNHGTVLHNSSSSGEMLAGNFTNTGSITASLGTLNLGTTFGGFSSTSSGTVTANATGRVNVIGNFTNSGNITIADSGIVAFQGTNTSAHLGNIILSGSGQAWLTGFLNNTDLPTPSGGAFLLVGGTINGGNVTGGSVLTTSSGGTFTSVNLTGTINLPAGTTATLTGNNTFTNATVSFGDNSSLRFGSTTGALVINANSTVTNDVSIDVVSSTYTGTTLTNHGNVTFSGTSVTGEMMAGNFTNFGNISSSLGTLNLGTTFAGFSSTNNGTITAMGTGAINLLGSFDNNNILRAQDSGSIIFQGSNSTPNLGTVQVAGSGHVRLNGTLNNTGFTLPKPAGGSFELYGGVINGGTIASQALTLTTSGGTLNAVTLNGTFSMPNATFAGLSGNNTFTDATVTFGTSSSLQLSTAGATLTIDSGSTLTGDISLNSVSVIGTELTNHGSIVHTTGSGLVSARTLINHGTITASGGSLSIGSSAGGFTTTNSPTGVMTVTAGSASLFAPLANQGSLRVQAGTLHTNGHLTTLGTGVLSGAGTITGGVTMAGGTIAPGNSIGSLTFSGGTFAVTAPTTLQLELNSTSTDALLFTSPVGGVNLGAGLISISLNLLAPPSLGLNYDIVRITSGGGSITGTFAGLPTTGSAMTASFAGTPYSFTVTYGSSVVSLAVVPEPSTYALMVLGAAVLYIAHRRRQRRG